MSTIAQHSVDVEIIKHLADQRDAALKLSRDFESKRLAYIAKLFPAGRIAELKDGVRVMVTRCEQDSIWAFKGDEIKAVKYLWSELKPVTRKSKI